MEVETKSELLDIIFVQETFGYISETGEFFNIPPKLQHTPLGIFLSGETCYSWISYSNGLCQSCRNKYAKSLLPDYKEKFDALKKAVKENDERLYTTYNDLTDSTIIYRLNDKS